MVMVLKDSKHKLKKLAMFKEEKSNRVVHMYEALDSLLDKELNELGIAKQEE